MPALERRDSSTALEDPVAGRRRHRILWVVTAALLLLSAAWIVQGFRFLLFQNPGAVDLKFRWLEQRYIWNGQNPYDVVLLEAAHRYHRPSPECTRNNRVDPAIGPLYHRQGGYPPWAYFTAMALVLPTEFQTTRIYFAALNALALTITFVWAYRLGRFHSRAGGIFLAAAALAVFGHFKTLDAGQYGILVNGLLIGVYLLVTRYRFVLAGITYGLAFLKPQISALFAIIFLVRRQWSSLVAATLYVVLASLGMWALIKTNPIEMLTQMSAIVQSWSHHPDPDHYLDPTYVPMGYSSFSHLMLMLHVDWKIATPLGAALGLFLTGVLMWLWRNGETLALFAVAATMGRLWSYHLNYDDVMLIFLVVALGKLVLARPSLGTILAFSLVGLTLWVPVRSWHKPYPLALQVAQVSIWLFGLAVLLAQQPRSRGLEDELKLNACAA
jgi:hypothetical protein